VANVLPENEESQRAWDGVLFDRFVKYRHLLVTSLAQHGTAAMRRFPPAKGARVLDIGCGFGDSTLQLAELIGAEGSALGVDISPRFIEAAREEASEIGGSTVRFEVMDVQASQFDDEFDYAFSRFGTMFFASPVAALRNVRAALADNGRLVMVVWRRREDNPWMHVAEQLVKPLIEIPEETDEARCGPGPFSMAGPDTVSAQLQAAGFDEISFLRLDLPNKLGNTLDEAIEMNLALGPAAEAVRLAGDEGESMKPYLRDLLRPALEQFVTDDGVWAMSSVWIVTASAA
jgi:SAM-dependent methyltransferase